jgi:lysozyme
MDAFDTLVMNEEGLRFQVYDDATGKPIIPGYIVVGHPTIGYGRALDTHGISVSEVTVLYQNGKQAVYKDLGIALSWFNGLDTVRQAVLASMAFNMGVAGLLQFHDTLAAVQAGNWQAVHDAMLASEWAKQLPLRSNQLAAIMYSGSLPTT